MNTFDAESAAWRIEAIGDDIAADARWMAMAVKSDAEAGGLSHRVAIIRKLAVAVEKAADAFEAALKET